MSPDFERKGSLGTQICIIHKTDKFRMLHEKMAHINIHTLYKACKNKAIYGHNMSDEELEKGYKNFEFCFPCGMGKSTQFTRKSSEAEQVEYLPGEFWYTDCVAFATPSRHGNTYWFPYLDRTSGLIKNYFGHVKTDVNAAHVQHINNVNLEGRNIKILSGDDEKIYNHLAMVKYLSRQLIKWRSSMYRTRPVSYRYFVLPYFVRVRMVLMIATLLIGVKGTLPLLDDYIFSHHPLIIFLYSFLLN
jgi:hypothetical protein